MAESSKNCPACNAAVRPNAVFCHHCGRPLSIPEANLPVIETQSLSAENLSVETDTVLAETPKVFETLAPVETLERPEINNGTPTQTALPTAESVNSQNETIIEKNAEDSIVAPPLSTKRYISRTEYVWTEATAPTWRIIVFSLLAFILVALLLWLNNFLR